MKRVNFKKTMSFFLIIVLFSLLPKLTSDIKTSYANDQYFFIASGDGFGVFLDENQKLKALGKNNFGQIGPISTDKCTSENGAILDCVLKLTELNFEFDGKIKSISAGENHVLIFTDKGFVYGLGSNTAGQLGDGTITSRNIPMKMIEIENAKEISAGGSHSLILLNDGRVKAVGYNGSGQLGDNTQTDRNVAVFVQYDGKDLTNVKAIAAGNNHSLFLLESGEVLSVGDNTYGQLGIGTNESKMNVTKIKDLSDVKAIAAGNNHSLFLLKNGQVKVSGGNWKGQLCIGNFENVNEPYDVKDLSDVKAVDAGGSFSLFLLNNGNVKVCGNNQYGQFGNNTTADSNVPVDMNINNVVQVKAGKDHVYILTANGKVSGVGNNLMGQLGDPERDIKKMPFVISNLNIPTNVSIYDKIPIYNILGDTIEKIETSNNRKIKDILTIKRDNKKIDLENIKKENTFFEENSNNITASFQKGDFIETNENGGVYFYFSKHNEIFIDKSSSLEFYNIDHDLLHYKQHSGKIWYKFKLNENNNNTNTGATIDDLRFLVSADNNTQQNIATGSTWYNMHKKTSNTMKFEVSTTNMLSIVKGTYFNVEILENGNEKLIMVDGSVEILDKRSNEIFTLNAGETFVAKAGSGNEIIKSEVEDDNCSVFCDIPKDAWYRDYVKKLKNKGIIKGKDSLKYAPNENITRAEALKIALKISNINEDNIDNVDIKFTDVSTNDWFYKFIYKAKSLNIIDGFSNNTFKPNDPITRAQALKILIKASNIKLDDKYNVNFSDVNKNDWFIQFLGWGVKNGIIKGYDDGTFKPNNNINRAEFAKIGSLMLDKLNSN